MDSIITYLSPPPPQKIVNRVVLQMVERGMLYIAVTGRPVPPGLGGGGGFRAL
jgi:hypothetical protein